MADIQVATAAAMHEYNRWSTASDTSRPAERSNWVCRLGDDGEWVETTGHRHLPDAETACHEQAMRASVEAAFKAAGA